MYAVKCSRRVNYTAQALISNNLEASPLRIQNTASNEEFAEKVLNGEDF